MKNYLEVFLTTIDDKYVEAKEAAIAKDLVLFLLSEVKCKGQKVIPVPNLEVMKPYLKGMYDRFTKETEISSGGLSVFRYKEVSAALFFLANLLSEPQLPSDCRTLHNAVKGLQKVYHLVPLDRQKEVENALTQQGPTVYVNLNEEWRVLDKFKQLDQFKKFKDLPIDIFEKIVLAEKKRYGYQERNMKDYLAAVRPATSRSRGQPGTTSTNSGYSTSYKVREGVQAATAASDFARNSGSLFSLF